MDEETLGLAPERMRRPGYRTVVMLSANYNGPPRRLASRTEMGRRSGEPPPEVSRCFGEILDRLGTDVLPFADQIGHPRYFAFVPGGGTWPGAFCDRICRAVRERLPGLQAACG
jgi:hypothetical protein